MHHLWFKGMPGPQEEHTCRPMRPCLGCFLSVCQLLRAIPTHFPFLYLRNLLHKWAQCLPDSTRLLDRASTRFPPYHGAGQPYDSLPTVCLSSHNQHHGWMGLSLKSFRLSPDPCIRTEALTLDATLTQYKESQRKALPMSSDSTAFCLAPDSLQITFMCVSSLNYKKQKQNPKQKQPHREKKNPGIFL